MRYPPSGRGTMLTAFRWGRIVAPQVLRQIEVVLVEGVLRSVGATGQALAAEPASHARGADAPEVGVFGRHLGFTEVDPVGGGAEGRFAPHGLGGLAQEVVHLCRVGIVRNPEHGGRGLVVRSQLLFPVHPEGTPGWIRKELVPGAQQDRRVDQASSTHPHASEDPDMTKEGLHEEAAHAQTGGPHQLSNVVRGLLHVPMGHSAPLFHDRHTVPLLREAER